MALKQIEIDGIGLVTLVKRRGNSNLRLSFSRSGEVRVSLPYWVPYQAGADFARQRSDWIARHRPMPPSSLHDQDRIGKAHRLIFQLDASKLKPSVRTARNRIVVTFPSTMTWQQAAVQAAAERGALKALKLEAEQLLPQRLNRLAAENNFEYSSVRVKKLASRWGSCSQHREITLNIFLMQLPWHLIDYVLIHELVHTEHLDHSAEFWARFERALPGAKALRKQLKDHRTVVATTPLAAAVSHA